MSHPDWEEEENEPFYSKEDSKNPCQHYGGTAQTPCACGLGCTCRGPGSGCFVPPTPGYAVQLQDYGGWKWVDNDSPANYLRKALEIDPQEKLPIDRLCAAAAVHHIALKDQLKRAEERARNAEAINAKLMTYQAELITNAEAWETRAMIARERAAAHWKTIQEMEANLADARRAKTTPEPVKLDDHPLAGLCLCDEYQRNEGHSEHCPWGIPRI